MIDLTCLCMTHGRNWLLPESVESFLRQEIPDGLNVEFLIFNDCPEQTYVTDLPRIRIINSKNDICDLSEKLNTGVEFSFGKWVMLWDDDDIFLKTRIKYMMNFIKCNPQYMAIRPVQTWVWDCGRITGLFRDGNWAMTCNRKHYLDCGGSELEKPCDQTSWKNMGNKAIAVWQNLEEVSEVYRWAGTGCPHVYTTANAGMDSKSRHKEYRDIVLKSQLFKRGELVLEHFYKQDYEKLVADAVGKEKDARQNKM